MSHYVSLHSTLLRLLDRLPSPPVELSDVTVNAPLPNIISPPPTSTWGGMGTIPTSDSVFGKGERNRDPTAFLRGQARLQRRHIQDAALSSTSTLPGALRGNNGAHVSLRLDDLVIEKEKDTTNAPSSCRINRATAPNEASRWPATPYGTMGYENNRSTSPQAVPSGSSLWVRIRIRRGYHGSFKISGIPTNSRVAGLIWTSPANPAASSVPSFNSTHAEFGLNQQTQRPSPFRVLYIWGYFVARIKYCAGGFVMPTLPPPHTDF
ncbi:hypothetical protein PC9H_002712 [Pleurotus ostreatus]|uniref:Uncharacterized protein n=1 Tax=Pleurotus ostreatus TaxID=5322 RepID=A0A8H6ZK01_PLEOS|nr:uncharacterized protein PC9H_002712 [Pleurotus ostreatus]KAF7416446.1 hypothetical protein PC9H_002712 [Pleurotus ostreatus]